MVIYWTPNRISVHPREGTLTSKQNMYLAASSEAHVNLCWASKIHFWLFGFEKHVMYAQASRISHESRDRPSKWLTVRSKAKITTKILSSTLSAHFIYILQQLFHVNLCVKILYSFAKTSTWKCRFTCHAWAFGHPSSNIVFHLNFNSQEDNSLCRVKQWKMFNFRPR